MDFLDPQKQRRHAILLFTGYILIGIAIAISTIVLIYQANGFGVNGKGQVVQKGLVFVSSSPNPAQIYLNDQLNSAQTNVRLSVPAATYKLKLTRTGYRDWTHTLTVLGGDVQNFDYPVLFPTNLTTSSQASYNAAPGLVAQSRDRRWLIVQHTPTAATFDIYDLKTSNKTTPLDAAKQLTLPNSAVTDPNSSSQKWELVQWSNDNQHVLFKHTYGVDSEYILVDRTDASKAVNLNQALSVKPNNLTLIDNKYDQYYFLDGNATLNRATLGAPTPVAVKQHVIDYKSYGTNDLVYATTDGASSGQVSIMVADDKDSFVMRQVPAGTTYLLDWASYGGTQYVVLAASSEGVAYVYSNPLGQFHQNPNLTKPTALRALQVPNMSYVGFSPTTRYIVSENGGQFSLYDIYLKENYRYTLPDALDAPQTHAQWVDGDHLTYISGGKLLVFDFDSRNKQTLMTANVAEGAFFSQDYRYVFAFASGTNNAVQLNRTALRTENDL